MERLELLKAASLGYEKQIERLTDAKAEIDNEIATKGIPRHISPEGRKRIIEAQKKRWAQAKKAKKSK